MATGDTRDRRMVPDPGRGEVLIRIGAAGICGTDPISYG
jgi:threonine dehydrogenase-like Zn-dependent dehydrogenase